MSETLFTISDAPHGNERADDSLRLAAALPAKDELQGRTVLRAEAAIGAKARQKVPVGFDNVQLLRKQVA